MMGKATGAPSAGWWKNPTYIDFGAEAPLLFQHDANSILCQLGNTNKRAFGDKRSSLFSDHLLSSNAHRGDSAFKE
jgi:hypothetical protein